MKVAVESLVAYEDWIRNPEKISKILESYGEVIILRENQPVYRITRIRQDKDSSSAYHLQHEPEINKATPRPSLTLREAVRTILQTAQDGEMHVSELTDLIFENGLYLKRDGSKAPYTQVRAMCGQYPEDFETLKRNRIRLVRKED